MYRTVDTATWDDPWLTELEPLDKLLFFYLLTNRRSTACGAFEITLKAMAFETGMSQQQVKAGLSRLHPKVVWFSAEQVIFVRNFYKHQRAQSNKDNFYAAATKKLADFPRVVQEAVWQVYPELCPLADGLPSLLDADDTHTHPIPMPPPSLGDKETVNATVEETVNATENAPVARARAIDFDAFFEDVWQRYPSREGVSKIGKAEFKALVRGLGAEEWPNFLKAVTNYAQAGRLPVDPIRFIKSRDYPQGLWRQFVNGGNSGNNGANRQNIVEIAGQEKPKSRVPGLREALEERARQAKGA